MLLRAESITDTQHGPAFSSAYHAQRIDGLLCIPDWTLRRLLALHEDFCTTRDSSTPGQPHAGTKQAGKESRVEGVKRRFGASTKSKLVSTLENGTNLDSVGVSPYSICFVAQPLPLRLSLLLNPRPSIIIHHFASLLLRPRDLTLVSRRLVLHAIPLEKTPASSNFLRDRNANSQIPRQHSSLRSYERPARSVHARSSKTLPLPPLRMLDDFLPAFDPFSRSCQPASPPHCWAMPLTCWSCV